MNQSVYRMDNIQRFGFIALAIDIGSVKNIHVLLPNIFEGGFTAVNCLAFFLHKLAMLYYY